MPWLAGEVATATKLNFEHPLGIVQTATSGANVTLATANVIVDTSATVTVTNNDTVTRSYVAEVRMRFSMSSGTNGLYRPVVSNGSAVNLGETVVQVFTNQTGGSGQPGGTQKYKFTLAASGTQVLAAAGDRIAGGSATDVALAGAVIDVTDLGRT